MADYTDWYETIYHGSNPEWPSTLCHHGTKGQKWGIRRYQNEDGSLTAAGRERYGVGEERGSFSQKKNIHKMTNDELKAAIDRRKLEAEYRRQSPAFKVAESGISLIKNAIEARDKRKKEEADRKFREKELDVRSSEARAREAGAKASRMAAKADLFKAKTERRKQGFFHRKVANVFDKRAMQRKIDQIAAEKDRELEIQESRSDAAYYIAMKAKHETMASVAKSVDKDHYDDFLRLAQSYK